MRQTVRGFTLIELLVAVAVLTILLVLAGPAFRDLVLNNQRATQLNALMSSLNLARAEAVKRGVRTIVCISDGATPADCDGASTQWEDGWIVFVDGNTAGGSLNALDSPADANGNGQWDRGEDALLEIHGPLAAGTGLCGNGTVTRRIRFDRSTGTAGTIRRCDSRGAGDARGIVIAPTGRPRAAMDGDGNGTVEDGAGTDVVCPCP